MNKRTHSSRGSEGFSLIEALITLVVLSFGLLAVARFQSTLVTGSAYNKARSEAVQLAQKKLDELRNYSTESGLVANLEANGTPVTSDTFPNSVADGTYPATAESIDGINASFTRQWVVACGADTCSVVVNVTWTDLQQGAQTVSLDTNLGWNNPRGAGDLVSNDFTPAVPSATGRAHLGSGTVTAAEYAAGTDHGDGTVKVTQVNGGDDVALVDSTANDDGTYNIVLTLEDACQLSDGVATCTNFVKISGRVYIESSFTASNVFVLASDAAYCARVNADAPIGTDTDADGNGVLDGNGDGTSDYTYFDYTCYLGGGWHGNIGVVLNGGGVHDTVCLGDPSASMVDGTEAWKRVELATRRVYRGMLYKTSGGSAITDGNGNILYYSKGIRDASVLPDPNWGDRNYGHDFVVTSVTGTATTASCKSVLTKPDAVSAHLFEGVSTDFVCLNRDNVSGATPYLDTFDTPYVAPDTCPYDPSRGPAVVHHVTGTINIASPTTLTGVRVETSAAEGNCIFNGTGVSTASYDCKVYDWGNDWNGYINVYPATGLFCPPPLEVLVASNTTSTTLTGKNFTCRKLNTYNIGGTVAVSAGQDLAGTRVITTVNGSEVGECTPLVTAGTSFNYTCAVTEPAINAGWTGAIQLLLPPALATVYPCTVEHTYSTPVKTNLTLQDFSSATFCATPVDAPAKVSGTVYRNGTPAPGVVGITVQAVDPTGGTATVSGSCVPDSLLRPAFADMLSGDTYTCTTGTLMAGVNWDVTVTYTTDNNRLVCYRNTAGTLVSGVTTLRVLFPYVVAGGTRTSTVTFAKATGDCPL